MRKFIVLLLSLMLMNNLVVSAQENYLENKDITADLILENSASYDERTNEIVLCPNVTWSNGKAKYPFEMTEDFTLTFEYSIGGGTSADGIMLAFFAQKDSVVMDGGYMNFEGCGGYGLEFDTFSNPGDSKNAHIALVYDKVSNHLISVDEPRVDDEKWHTAKLSVECNNIEVTIDGDIIINEQVQFNKEYRYMYFAATTGLYSDNHSIRNVKFTGRAAFSNASNWAIEEMDKAEMYELIPALLKGKDMTKTITREEFAALSVQLYEKLNGEEADIVDEPFEDADGVEIAKAYGLGITNGVSENIFEPDSSITREQVATMLTRTMKVYLPDLDTTVSNVKKFADDDKISDWAKESVYFMVKHNIIMGIGNNMFAPKNTTADEEAIMYANSTREQALLMSVRAYETINK